MEDNWKDEAWDWALDRLETIDNSYTTNDFIQFEGRIGGDILVYRYHKNGLVTEK